jgi:hypothetical protein
MYYDMALQARKDIAHAIELATQKYGAASLRVAETQFDSARSMYWSPDAIEDAISLLSKAQDTFLSGPVRQADLNLLQTSGHL